jgi:hypothetical protein
MLSGDQSTNDLFSTLSTNWEFFGQAFGWGLENGIDLDLGITNTFFENGQIGPVSSTENLSAAWLLAATPRHGSPADGNAEERRDPFGRSHDNPWVSSNLLTIALMSSPTYFDLKSQIALSPSAGSRRHPEQIEIVLDRSQSVKLLEMPCYRSSTCRINHFGRCPI